MRALVVTSSYPTRVSSLSGAFIAEWQRAVRAQGVLTATLTWQEAGARSCTPCMTRSDSIAVRYAPDAWQTLFHGAGLPDTLRASPWLAALLPQACFVMGARLLRETLRLSPDLLVGHWLLPAGPIVRLVGALTRTPSLIVTHSGGVGALERLPRACSIPLARALAQGPMTFVSPHTRARFERYALAPEGEILPMGYSVDLTASAVASARCGAVMLGRAVPIKGGAASIEAWSHAHASRRGREPLHVVGEGPCLNAWREVASRCGVNARFHGALYGRARDEIVGGCRVALFGSKRLDSGRQEGLPVSMLECAALGAVPMVAEVGGGRAYVQEPSVQGLDVSRAPARWAQQINALLSTPDLERLREAQRERVAALAWERLGPKWAEALKRHSMASR